MRTSSTRAVAIAAALLLLAACGGPPEPGEAAEAAHAAWKLYLSRPADDTYFNFIKLNSTAASPHAGAVDAAGLEYRCRAFEVMAAEAERKSDATMADQVVDQVAVLERRELLDTFDEVLKGSKRRILDAKARAEKVAR